MRIDLHDNIYYKLTMDETNDNKIRKIDVLYENYNGYVYDICLNILDSFTYNYLYSSFNSTSFNSSNFKNYFNNVTTGYYINVTQDQINQFVNCSVRDSVIYSDLGYSPLSVT